MPIAFDDSAADTLSTSASKAATALRGQSPTRRSAAENACDDFSGGYARLFETACSTESEDRLKLAGVLDDLCDDIAEAKQLAKDEKDRQADLDAWEKRDAERAKDPSILNRLEGRLSDPKPTDPPIAAPTISAAFAAQQRTRFSGSNRSGKTSAKPDALRSFATTSKGKNTALDPYVSSLRTAWSSFVSNCSWLSFGTATFVDGFDQYLKENTTDVTWIEGIAQAFEDAGSGEISNFQLSLAVAAGQPQYLKDVLTSDDLSPEQIAAAAEYLSKHPELAPQVGKIVSDEVRGLDFDSTKEEVSRAAALLNGFSKNGPASAAILDNLGADNLIQALSLAGALAYGGDGPSSADLAKGLRSVFRTGEPEMTDAKSRQFARDIVSYLRGDRMNTPQPGNDPYALSYLLRDSKLSTPFLGELGNELDAFERSFGETGYTWGQMSTMAHGGGWFFDEGDRAGAFDPMASYMSALGLNGEASLQFFTGTGAEHASDYLTGAQALDRQEYWIERRRWGHDNFDGLFSALDSATTSSENLDNPQATKLVSTSFEMLANRTQGEDAAGNKVGFGTDDEKILPGNLGNDASRHLAHVFGTYMESVDYHINEPVDDRTHIGATTNITRSDLGDLKGMPRFNKDDLALLAQAGLSSDDGFSAFRQAVTNYQDVHIAQAVQNHYGTPVFNSATNYDARLEAFFMDNLGEVKIADGLEKDDQIKAWIGLGSDLAGQIPFDKVPVAGSAVNFLAGQGLDAGTDALTDYLAHYEKDAITDANQLAEEALDNRRNSIVGALYENGAITREQVDEQAAALGIPQGDVDRWLANGFPDSKTIRTEQGDLRSLVSALGEDRFDLNQYRLNYENEFRDYFE